MARKSSFVHMCILCKGNDQLSKLGFGAKVNLPLVGTPFSHDSSTLMPVCTHSRVEGFRLWTTLTCQRLSSTVWLSYDCHVT